MESSPQGFHNNLTTRQINAMREYIQEVVEQQMHSFTWTDAWMQNEDVTVEQTFNKDTNHFIVSRSPYHTGSHRSTDAPVVPNEEIIKMFIDVNKYLLGVQNKTIWLNYVINFGKQFHSKMLSFNEETRNNIVFAFNETTKQFVYDDFAIEAIDKHYLFSAFCLQHMTESSSFMDIILAPELHPPISFVKHFIRCTFLDTLVSFIREIGIQETGIRGRVYGRSQPMMIQNEQRNLLRKQILNILLPMYFVVNEIKQSILHLFGEGGM